MGMKWSSIVLIGCALLCSCGHKPHAITDIPQQKDSIIYTMHTIYRDAESRSRIDTIAGFPEHDELDTLIASSRFNFMGIEHVVYAFSNFRHAEIDGDLINLELDSVGVIYSNSTNWGGYSIIWTNSDSLNLLTSMALGAACRVENHGIQQKIWMPMQVPD